MQATSSTRTRPKVGTARDEQEIYDRFVSLLRNDTPLSIPLETFYGGITHFICTLPSSDIGEFLLAISASQHVWDDAKSAKEAIRLGCVGRMISGGKEAKGKGRAWWPFGQSDQDEWADAAFSAVLDIQDGRRKVQMACSLLEGMVSAAYKGRARGSLEEEVVLLVAQSIDASTLDLDLVAVIPAISSGSLKVLDLAALSTTLRTAMMDHLRGLGNAPPETQPDIIPALSKALARVLEVRCRGGPADVHGAMSDLEDFGSGMRDLARSASSFAIQKTRLFAFLLPALAALPSLFVRSVTPCQSSDSPAVQCAIDILNTLSAFASLFEESAGGAEGYHRLLYGCLDIVAASGSLAVRDLLRLPNARLGKMRYEEAGWWLVICESLVHLLDGTAMRDAVIPLVQRYIYQPESKSSLEAAHAVVLAILRVASESASSQQADFLDQLMAWYAPLLLAQVRRKHVTSDQLREAYIIIVRCASAVSNDLLHSILDLLDAPQAGSLRNELLRVRIAVAPAIPQSLLQGWLRNVELDMGTLPTAQRADLKSEIFKMVMEDLPDSSRRIGMEWWTKAQAV